MLKIERIECKYVTEWTDWRKDILKNEQIGWNFLYRELIKRNMCYRVEIENENYVKQWTDGTKNCL